MRFSFSPSPILHRCTVQVAGWPKGLSGSPNVKNTPDPGLRWSPGPPELLHGSSRGHICVNPEQIWLETLHKQGFREQLIFILHLNGIESRHVHLHEAVFPVVLWNPGVVDTTWYVLKGLPVFQEAVILIVNGKSVFCRDLQQN